MELTRQQIIEAHNDIFGGPLPEGNTVFTAEELDELVEVMEEREDEAEFEG